MKKTSTKGKSVKSAPSNTLKQSRLKDLKRDIEMKKLILEQEQELAQFDVTAGILTSGLTPCLLGACARGLGIGGHEATVKLLEVSLRFS